MGAAGVIVLALAVLLGAGVASGRLTPKHYPVLLAYVLGLAIGASGVLAEADRASLRVAMRFCVAIAIPALLLQANIATLRALGREGLLAGVAVWIGAVAAGVACTSIGGLAPVEAAVTFAIFTGSLANLQAAGLALGLDDASLVAANAGDVLAGGVLFAGLVSLGPGAMEVLLSRPAAPQDSLNGTMPTEPTAPVPSKAHDDARIDWKASGLAVFYSTMSLAGGLLLSRVADSGRVPEELFVLGGATVLAVGLGSTVVSDEVARASSRLGDGLLVAFCVLVGTGADVSEVYGGALSWACWMGVFLVVQLTVATAVARLFGIGAGAFVLAIAGAVYSPAFVGPVAHATRRPDLIPIGIAWGLFGLAVGTPAAVALAAWWG